MSELMAFSSYEEADAFIRNEEIRTFTKYIKLKMYNNPNTKGVAGRDFTGSLKDHRITFEDMRGFIMLPFDGVPFIAVGNEYRGCHHGPARTRNRDEKEKKTETRKIKKKRPIADQPDFPEDGEYWQDDEQSSTSNQQLSKSHAITTYNRLTFKATNNEPLSLAKGLIQELSHDASISSHVYSGLQAATCFLEGAEHHLVTLKRKLKTIAPQLQIEDFSTKVVPKSNSNTYSIEVAEKQNPHQKKTVSNRSNDLQNASDIPCQSNESPSTSAIVSQSDLNTSESLGQSAVNDLEEVDTTEDIPIPMDDKSPGNEADAECSVNEEAEESGSKSGRKKKIPLLFSMKGECRAVVKMKAIIRFPRFKMTRHDNKKSRSDILEDLRSAVLTEEDKEYRCYVRFIGEHTGHSVGQIEGEDNKPIDPVIVKHIRKVVREHGMMSSGEMNEHLDRYRATLGDNLPPGSRYFPTPPTIKNHIQAAVSSLIAKQLTPTTLRVARKRKMKEQADKIKAKGKS